jgi:hypothetical protein
MNFKVLLALSLLANTGLAYFALRQSASAPADSPTVAQSTSGAASAAKQTALAAKPAVKLVESTITNTVVKRFTWESVESPDYKEYIANLRAVGCPDETIRDIIIADVNKLYEAKKKLVRGTPKKFEYWKGGNPMAAFLGDSETRQKMQALDEEKNGVLRALGIEPDFKSATAQMMNPLETMFDFVPDAKKSQLVKLMTDAQTKMAKAMEGGGRPDPEDIAKVQKEMETSIKQLLTPEEALDYDLRMSMTANMMRMQSAGFDPDEKEFLDVFKLRKGFDDEFSPLSRGNETEATRKKREEAEKQLKEQIKQTLGEARYKDYELAQDYNFQNMHNAAKRAGLGTSEAKQVYDMKKLAEAEAKKIRDDKNLDQERKSAALDGIRQETEKSIQAVMGQKGWENYNRPNNIGWLNGIYTKPRPASTSQ